MVYSTTSSTFALATVLYMSAVSIQAKPLPVDDTRAVDLFSGRNQEAGSTSVSATAAISTSREEGEEGCDCTADAKFHSSVSVTGTSTNSASDKKPSPTTPSGNSTSEELEDRGQYGTLIIRLGDHVEIKNETNIMNDRDKEEDTIDYIIPNNQDHPYSADWSFTAYSPNEDGEWGSQVHDSLILNNLTCHLNLKVASFKGEVVVHATDTGRYVKEIDTAGILDMECDGDYAKVA